MAKTTILWSTVREYSLVEFRSDDVPRALVVVSTADVEREYASRESEFACDLLGATMRILGHAKPQAQDSDLSRLSHGFEAGVPMFFVLVHASGVIAGFEPASATFAPDDPPSESQLRTIGMAAAVAGLRHPTWTLSGRFSIGQWSTLPVPWSPEESGAHWRSGTIDA